MTVDKTMKSTSTTFLLGSEWHGAKVLITGGGGFVGPHLAELFGATPGVKVTMVSRRSSDLIRPLSNVEVLSLDLLDRESLMDLCATRKFDYVFHMAGKTDQKVWPGVYQEMFRLNMETTLNLIDALAGSGLKRFIHAGSSMEYGNAPYPQGPHMEEQPLSGYGVAKLASTKMVVARSISEDFPGTVVRPFLVYGHGQRQEGFLPSAVRAAKAGVPLEMTGGAQTRDFIPITKFCADMLEIAQLPENDGVGKIFNLCTGVGISFSEILDLVKERYPSFEANRSALPYRKSEVMDSVGHPYRAWSREQALSALRDFLAGT